MANLRYSFDCIQHVDWVKPLPQEDNKAMPGTDCLGIPASQIDHGLIGSAPAYQALPRGFTKSDTKLDTWNSIDQGFVHIFHRLDKVGLTQNKIDLFWFFNFHTYQVHL